MPYLLTQLCDTVPHADLSGCHIACRLLQQVLPGSALLTLAVPAAVLVLPPVRACALSQRFLLQSYFRKIIHSGYCYGLPAYLPSRGFLFESALLLLCSGVRFHIRRNSSAPSRLSSKLLLKQLLLQRIKIIIPLTIQFPWSFFVLYSFRSFVIGIQVIYVSRVKKRAAILGLSPVI